MKITENDAECWGIRFSVQDDSGKEIGRAYLYVMYNSLHKEPFGLMEDVFINPDARGKGIGLDLIKRVIEGAKERGCYKLIATSRHSRPEVHHLYENLGFKNQGIEFRIDF